MDPQMKRTYKHYLKMSTSNSPKYQCDIDDEQQAFHIIRHHIERNPCDELKFIQMKHKYNSKMRERSLLGYVDMLTFNRFNPWQERLSWL